MSKGRARKDQAKKLRTQEKGQKCVYRPQRGGEIRTTAILPNIGERTTRAKVRQIKGDRVEVIYGIFSDRAWVPIGSCKFVRKGQLSNLDREKFAPTFG